MSYRLVVKEGRDVLHRHPPLEQCNLDDSTRDELIDDRTADFLMAAEPPVHRCEHCFPPEVA